MPLAIGSEKDGLTHEELRERLPWKFSQLFPGPKPPQYTLDQFSPYRLNQRCADTFKKGRVLLAGDAAHRTFHLMQGCGRSPNDHASYQPLWRPRVDWRPS